MTLHSVRTLRRHEILNVSCQSSRVNNALAVRQRHDDEQNWGKLWTRTNGTSMNVPPIRNWRWPDASCSLTRWQHFSVWNDAIATVLKFWCQIKNLTLSVNAYLRKKVHTKFHPDPIWNDGDLGFFVKWCHSRHFESITSYSKSDSVNAHSLEIKSCRISCWSDLKRWNVRLFRRGRPNKNKTSSDMRSVPGGKIIIIMLPEYKGIKCTINYHTGLSVDIPLQFVQLHADSLVRMLMTKTQI